MDVFGQRAKMMSVNLYPRERKAGTNGIVLDALLQDQSLNPGNG